MTNPNVRPDLEALKVLLSKATPGDWKFDGDWHRIPTFVSDDGAYLAYAAKAGFPEHDSHTPEQAANAALIVAMRNSIPDLIAHIERLQNALKPFAAFRLSTEGEVSDCVLRTPAAEARLRADAIERRDAEIAEARATLSQGTSND